MKYKVILLCSLATLVTGCARDISPNIYSERHVGEASRTFRGVVTHVRSVSVQGSERLQDNVLGGAAGGVAGGLAGSAFGRGKGQLATTLLGAAAGATAGALAEKELKKQQPQDETITPKKFATPRIRQHSSNIHDA